MVPCPSSSDGNWASLELYPTLEEDEGLDFLDDEELLSSLLSFAAASDWASGNGFCWAVEDFDPEGLFGLAGCGAAG